MLRKIGPFVILVILTAACINAFAKVIDITLSELVEKSDFIAYGYSAIPDQPLLKGSELVVLFKPITVLKNKNTTKKKHIYLCKMQPSSESYDLAAIEGSYVVFGSLNDQCYQPVHWISSIIKTKEGIAQTSAIADQPEQQPLSDFLKKINFFVEKEISK